MKIQLGLVGLAAIFVSSVGVTTDQAQAACAVSDYICEKFSRKKVKPARAKVRRQNRRNKRRVSARVRSAKVRRIRREVTPIRSASIKTSLNNTGLNQKIVATSPVVQVARLAPGAIASAPQDMTNLIYASAEQVQSATAKCNPLLRSAGRVVCQIAVHRLTLTGEAGSGCSGALDLRTLKFTRDEKGAWTNEDSISLCGGRLLRRTTLFPVSVNGQSRYALSEKYQMLGGDGACATPYLRSRYPLQKSYMPVGKKQPHSLTCGAVAIR